MSKKITIPYNGSAESIPLALGVPDERLEELTYKMELAIHDMFRPSREPLSVKSDAILKIFLSHAENQQEAIFLAYMAGVKTEELLLSNGDFGIYEEDEE